MIPNISEFFFLNFFFRASESLGTRLLTDDQGTPACPVYFVSHRCGGSWCRAGRGTRRTGPGGFRWCHAESSGAAVPPGPAPPATETNAPPSPRPRGDVTRSISVYVSASSATPPLQFAERALSICPESRNARRAR